MVKNNPSSVAGRFGIFLYRPLKKSLLLASCFCFSNLPFFSSQSISVFFQAKESPFSLCSRQMRMKIQLLTLAVTIWWIMSKMVLQVELWDSVLTGPSNLALRRVIWRNLHLRHLIRSAQSHFIGSGPIKIQICECSSRWEQVLLFDDQCGLTFSLYKKVEINACNETPILNRRSTPKKKWKNWYFNSFLFCIRQSRALKKILSLN